MFEATKSPQGGSRAKAICDDCGTATEFSCRHERRKEADPSTVAQGQAIKTVTGMGWSYLKGKLRCPACEANRKAASQKEDPPEAAPAAPREPTRQQRREIIDMLTEVYDTEAERYRQGDTDETVADVLGVMPGWVAQIREEFFGEDGGNSDIDALVAEIDGFREHLAEVIRNYTYALEQVRAAAGKADAMAEQLAKIKKAVGPRKLAVAGVQK